MSTPVLSAVTSMVASTDPVVRSFGANWSVPLMGPRRPVTVAIIMCLALNWAKLWYGSMVQVARVVGAASVVIFALLSPVSWRGAAGSAAGQRASASHAIRWLHDSYHLR